MIDDTDIECLPLDWQIRADQFCVSSRMYKQRGGYHLVEDDAGLRQLRLQAVSLAGKSEWTEYMEFYPHVVVPVTRE